MKLVALKSPPQNTNHQFSLSGKDFKEEVWRLFIKLNEIMEIIEWKTNKNQEEV